jgi:hypothetical protein
MVLTVLEPLSSVHEILLLGYDRVREKIVTISRFGELRPAFVLERQGEK